MSNAGRLPRPSRAPSPAALRLLDLYDRAEAGERDARAILQYEIARVTKQDLADYYAGVRLRLMS